MVPGLPGLALAAWLSSAAAMPPVPVAAPPVEVVAPPAPVEEPTPESPLRRDASAHITVLRAEERRGEACDLPGLLAAAPGLTLSTAGGYGQASRLSMRGAASNGVLVLLDGAPLSLNGAGADLSRVPLAAVDRVEVLRGGGGRYAPGALGGVVNVVTRAPGAEDVARASATLTAGAFDTQTAQLAGESPLWGGAGLVLLHGGRSRGNFPYVYDDRPLWDGNAPAVRERQNNQSRQGGALLRYRRAVAGWDADAMVELFAEARGLAGTAQNPTPDAQQEGMRALVTVRAARVLGPGQLLSLRAHGMEDRTTLSGGMFGTGLRQRQSQAGMEGTWEAAAWTHHHLVASLQAGFEGLEGSSDAQARGWGRVGALLVDDVQWGAWVLSPSARVDRAGPFTTFSPKLGVLGRLPWGGLEVRANAGQAARAPSFAELYLVQGTLLPNAQLRPERALSADVGLGQALERGRWGVAGFYALYEDLISYELYPPFLARPYNFSAARAYGAEVDGEARPAEWLALQAGYTLTFTENLRDDPRFYGRELPYRPRHRAYGRVVGGPAWLKGRAEVLAQSAQGVNRAATVTLPARAFLNVGVTAAPWRSPDVTVSAELKNLLDVQGSDLDGYPLPGRAAYLTVSVALDAGRRARDGRP